MANRTPPIGRSCGNSNGGGHTRLREHSLPVPHGALPLVFLPPPGAPARYPDLHEAGPEHPGLVQPQGYGGGGHTRRAGCSGLLAALPQPCVVWSAGGEHGQRPAGPVRRPSRRWVCETPPRRLPLPSRRPAAPRCRPRAPRRLCKRCQSRWAPRHPSTDGLPHLRGQQQAQLRLQPVQHLPLGLPSSLAGRADRRKSRGCPLPPSRLGAVPPPSLPTQAVLV